MPTEKFLVEGKRTLKGNVTVSGSKNGALPILCASLLTSKTSTIHNVPDITDIHHLLKIFKYFNVESHFENNTVTINPSTLSSELHLNQDAEKLICSMRGSILLLGPLLARNKNIRLPLPGGCVLGKRPVEAHLGALEALGAVVHQNDHLLHLSREVLKNNAITMSEMSVTATENALMLAAVIPGTTEIRLAAAEPQVQDLCHFLEGMGVKIKGIGTHFLTIEGIAQNQLQGIDYTIQGDYLEAGTFAIATAVTYGEVTINGFETSQLESFWLKLKEAGIPLQLEPHFVKISPAENIQAVSQLRTAIYPSFPTDLQAPFAVLLTQAKGKSHIFETLFEGRLNYLFELEKMGAKVQMLNQHEATIEGPVALKGVALSSLDLRAGAAMILAALCAEGTTEISNINFIDRGYQNFEKKLQNLGANIERKIITEE